MKIFMIFGIAGMLLSSIFQTATQKKSTIVTLTVLHNGQLRPAPTEIKLSFKGHELRVAVRDGRFAVPPEVIAAQHVTLESKVDDSRIRMTHITGKDFAEVNWTLRLAEQANDEYYEWPGPKNAKISATCMLEFDSGHEDPARVLFEEDCRSKIH